MTINHYCVTQTLFLLERDDEEVHYDDGAKWITIGFLTFQMLPGFEEAVANRKFDEGRFLDIITTLIGCNLVYDKEQGRFCAKRQLPSLALEAARCPYVLGDIEGDPMIDTALRVYTPANRIVPMDIKSLLPSKLLVALIQPDLDYKKVEAKFLETYVENGCVPLPYETVLAIIQSEEVKTKPRTLCCNIL